MFEFPSLSAMIYISNTVTSYNHVDSSTVYCDTWNSVNNALNNKAYTVVLISVP